MKEFFRINNIDVGFANHPTEGTFYTKGSLNTEVLVRKGKLRISLLTPPLEITDEMHNGLLDDAYYDNSRHIDYLRMVTYSDLEVESGKYNTQITCPYTDNLAGFETYNFPEDVTFYGIIDLQEGYVHIKGVLRSRFDEKKPSIPVEIVKCFEPKPLLPKRKHNTWEEALKENPLQVYDLRIDKGVFNEFPKEILSFKNLEHLWIAGQAQLNFATLPDEFYQLKELHTLLICWSRINHLSEKINQLQKLEELAIEYSQIKYLPAAIASLPKLETLSLRYNKLESVPENICETPGLKNLDLTGNNFKSLPKCLTKIENVEAERKHRKLFMDLSYASKNLNSVDESLYNLSNYPKQKAQLEQSIFAIPELKAFKALIVDYSTMATHLVLDKEKQNIPIGTSKVGGTPDLAKNIEYPKNKNGLFYIFHAQLNCEEIAPYQNYLPRKGMLYFFIYNEQYAENPVVLYSETDKNLTRFEYPEGTQFTDSDFDNHYRKAVAVTFQNVLSLPGFYNSHNYGAERFPKYASWWENPKNKAKVNVLEEYDLFEKLSIAIAKATGSDNKDSKLRTHSLNSFVFAQNESPQEIAADRFGGEPDEWLVLLNMESTGEFSFGDAGTLTYCIHKKDLAINDFSTISASIESS